MEIIPGNYVKAVFDFETSQAGEICIKTGQIILVTNVVDDNWVCGKLDGKEGNIPTNFVEKINVPQIKSSQKLFLSIETFKSSEDGDLNFEKGILKIFSLFRIY
ncbi:hypothetical protein SNE40_002849 [Patella caerulea]|uniref:SH3 domain-containing protein n=1 Tax=Patella caerulea TaxID=87958 RepID=A0AAN8Q096_PATCE